MAQKITRTVQFTRILCVKTVVENRVPRIVPQKDIIVFSKVADTKKAESIVLKVYGHGCTIIDVVREAGLYEMDLDKFVSLATKVKDVSLEEADAAADGDDIEDNTPTVYDDDDADDGSFAVSEGGGNGQPTAPAESSSSAPTIEPPATSGLDAPVFPDDEDDIPAFGDDDVPPDTAYEGFPE